MNPIRLNEDPDTVYDHGERVVGASDRLPSVAFIIYKHLDTGKTETAYTDWEFKNDKEGWHNSVRRNIDKKYPGSYYSDRQGMHASDVKELVIGRIWQHEFIASTYQLESEVMKYAKYIEDLFKELNLDIMDFKWDFSHYGKEAGLKPWPRIPKSQLGGKEMDEKTRKELHDLIIQLHTATPEKKAVIRKQIFDLQKKAGLTNDDIEGAVKTAFSQQGDIEKKYGSMAQANYMKGAIAEVKFRVYNSTMDTNIWNDDMTLKPGIRSTLLKIAKDFYKSTDLKGGIYNVLMIGSTAGYNWTPESDLDLHVVVDMTKDNINPEHARALFDGFGSKWNNNHEITVKGHPVELYIQDIREKNSTPALTREGAAVYSILMDEWVQKPNKDKVSIDKEDIRKKYRHIKEMIKDFVKTKDLDKLKSLMKGIKNFRDSGLSKDGEFGTDNLVFKALRRTGELEKLKTAINTIYDDSVTIDEAKKKAVTENKFNPHSTKELEFVTYGGLKLQKQDGYKVGGNHTFHEPPARYGIYAFVWPYVEKFLLGGNSFVNPKLRGKGKRNRIKYVRDKDGNVVTNDHPDYDKYGDVNKNWSMRIGDDDMENDMDPKWKLYNNHNRKKFKYNGPLWHHLGAHVREGDVIARHGDWVKTDMKPFVNAFKKELHTMLKGGLEWSKGNTQQNIGIKGWAKDHLEVFIDEKI